MNIFKGFGRGVGAYSKAFRFIMHNKLSWFFIFPVLLNILLFAFGYSWITGMAYSLETLLDGYLDTFVNEYINNEYLRMTLAFLLNVIFRISFFIAFMFFSGYIIVAIMSPVFSLLSEKTERILSGKEYPFDLFQFIKDVIRGVLLAIRNAFLQILAAILLFFLSSVPLLGLVTPFLMFFISSYFYGFSFIDYAIERRRLNIKESASYMRTNKGLVIGNGLVFALLLLIPVLGVFLSAFAAIVSVVAGTMLVHEERGLDIN